ncbi:MAG: hypothetical protein PVI37_04700 [Gammaproteobacteria bacterium]|jgi:hypothetical protein
MDVNLQSWPDLLLSYGPYAILALFVLWVVPRSSKRMQAVTENAPPFMQATASAAVVISWVVVLAMVAYVLVKWSPVRVYSGQLGVLKQNEQIYPLDDNIYVKVSGIEIPGRERWQFVLVGKERNINRDGDADFTYYWGDGPNDYTDYIIPIASIVDGAPRKFRFTKKDPEKVYRWENQRWEVAIGPIHTQSQNLFGPGWTAYAADQPPNLSKIRSELASPNRVLRAEGRKALRSLSDGQLAALKAMADKTVVLHQIRLEERRRHH